MHAFIHVQGMKMPIMITLSLVKTMMMLKTGFRQECKYELTLPFFRIAKKMLLAQIKSNYSSGGESSSDGEGGDKEGKKSKKVKTEKKDDDDDDDDDDEGEEDQEDDEEYSPHDSASDVDVKKGRRHALLRQKLTLSEGESADEKSAGKGKKNKETKKRAWRKVGSDDSDSEFEKSGSASDDESVISEEVTGSEEDGKRRKTRASKKKDEEKRSYKQKQKKKRRRIKIQDSSSSNEKSGDDDDEDGEDGDDKDTPKGRKKIRKILKDDKLRTETRDALKEEEERRRRIAEREALREKLREVSKVK
ncbi:Transcriptional regulator ATRX [Merluccius polli]|uniref:DNA helicase n=1 Tax=Merluccius polli TaxID=89951 RepID=A0AA47P9E2_MERPO|nr:Transcriptional regulator ATRX [Merluccius polli]